MDVAELTGSGSSAIAASIASFMMPSVSGGKHALGKSFIDAVPVGAEIYLTNRSTSRSTHLLSLRGLLDVLALPPGGGKSQCNVLTLQCLG